jgi:hypothetical protein
MSEEVPKIDPAILESVVKGEATLKHTAPPVDKQSLLSEVRKEGPHAIEHLKHTETCSKSDLLSEVRHVGGEK